jgi:hypothetical protein
MQESLNPISAMIFTSDFVLVIVNVSPLLFFNRFSHQVDLYPIIYCRSTVSCA